MSNIVKSRMSFAAAAALLAIASATIASPASAAAKDEPGRCYGVNSCKGQSLCATAKNDCRASTPARAKASW